MKLTDDVQLGDILQKHEDVLEKHEKLIKTLMGMPQGYLRFISIYIVIGLLWKAINELIAEKVG